MRQRRARRAHLVAFLVGRRWRRGAPHHPDVPGLRDLGGVGPHTSLHDTFPFILGIPKQIPEENSILIGVLSFLQIIMACSELSLN